ncbi:MAG: tetratricopeptide repeat protein [Saprospirales bacterium]|nr:tetratricopeptide repeat protein [Saprospirales bacterium]
MQYLKEHNQTLLEDIIASQEKALQYEDYNPDANYSLGISFFQQGDWGKAKTYFEAAVEQAPFWHEPSCTWVSVMKTSASPTWRVPTSKMPPNFHPGSTSQYPDQPGVVLPAAGTPDGGWGCLHPSGNGRPK